MTTQPRKPPGSPAGGQFAGHSRGEANVHLSGDSLALQWEDVPWEPGETAIAMSARQRRAASKPTYQAAIPARIADMDFDLDLATVTESAEAHAEIARFDAELQAFLPDVEFAPLPSVLLRTESASSSQIEQITTGARSLALAEIGIAKYGSNAGLVAANVAAMHRALGSAERLTSDSIRGVHLALMDGQPHALPGNFRSEPVWIGSGPSPHSADFVPPHHERLEGAVDDLCAFMERPDIPLLAQVAIAHAQFETIHPFNDGNGRTGRALVHVALRNGGATTKATVPVSAGLLRDTDGYFAALNAYRAGDPNPIIGRFSEATFAAIANGRTLATDMQAIHEEWSGRLGGRARTTARLLLPHLMSQPAVTSAVVQERLEVSQPTADAAIRALREAGILTKASGVQRYTAWIAADVIGALDDFATRSRRR